MGPTTELDRAVSDRLAQHELRYTSGRRAIVAALRQIGGPVTLPELLEFAGEVPQSSAYRNLALMESAGVVRRLVHGADHAYYELAEELTGHHHHLICESCGSVDDFTLDDDLEVRLEHAFDRATRAAGARSMGHLIDVFVVCADCSARSER
ncbi:Fur family transcriptional regulator [Ilumatobacter sp.]|uniref:Fur family transcriptional regulator n=1 Tax=Ilumatobacter sp. TaxID=1967498 RepID=UPI003B52D5C5